MDEGRWTKDIAFASLVYGLSSMVAFAFLVYGPWSMVDLSFPVYGRLCLSGL